MTVHLHYDFKCDVHFVKLSATHFFVKEVLECIHGYIVVILSGQEFIVKSRFTDNHNLVKYVL